MISYDLVSNIIYIIVKLIFFYYIFNFETDRF